MITSKLLALDMLDIYWPPLPPLAHTVNPNTNISHGDMHGLFQVKSHCAEEGAGRLFG